MEISNTIMRLFADDMNSEDAYSLTSFWDESEIEAVTTPPGNCDCKLLKSPLVLDEDSGLGMETDEIEEQTDYSPYTQILDDRGLNGSYSEFFDQNTSNVDRSRVTRKSLFAGKRLAEKMELDDLCPTPKRTKQTKPSLLRFALTNSPVDNSNVENIIRAVDLLTTDAERVADGSRDYCLPTILGKHGDLKTISADTMSQLLERPGADRENILIVDSRYPFEYQGGHIKGAVNLYTKEQVYALLNQENKPRVIVFHCEFSSERGPKMYRFLRSCDRECNKDNYPKLHFPEIYILGGGYKEFYFKHKNHCDPEGYKPMLHKDHASDLRHFRVKSKSWAGTNQRKHAPKPRLSRSCLSLKY